VCTEEQRHRRCSVSNRRVETLHAPIRNRVRFTRCVIIAEIGCHGEAAGLRLRNGTVFGMMQFTCHPPVIETGAVEGGTAVEVAKANRKIRLSCTMALLLRLAVLGALLTAGEHIRTSFCRKPGSLEVRCCPQPPWSSLAYLDRGGTISIFEGAMARLGCAAG
jgi:hypothetical protein